MKILKKIKNKFSEHPESIGESYTEHFKYAAKTAVKLQLVSGIFFMHGCCPWLGTERGSTELEEIYQSLANRKWKAKNARY